MSHFSHVIEQYIEYSLTLDIALTEHFVGSYLQGEASGRANCESVSVD